MLSSILFGETVLQIYCTQSLSCVQFFVALWTVACQAPLSVVFPRQEWWSGLPFPPLGDLPDPGIEPGSPVSPALQETIFFFYCWAHEEASLHIQADIFNIADNINTSGEWREQVAVG